MAADTLCVCPMATWLRVCRSVIIVIINMNRMHRLSLFPTLVRHLIKALEGGAPMRVDAPGQRQERASSRWRICSTLTSTSRSGSRKGASIRRLSRRNTCTYTGTLFV